MGKKLNSYADYRMRENVIEYDFYVKRFKRLLLTMFDWKNLPMGITERFVEDKLYKMGMLIFFKSKKQGFYKICQATATGLNGYEEPTGYNTYEVGGSGEYVKAEDCVPIWNDFFKEGNGSNVRFFAKKLSNIEKTVDLNLEQLKNPYVISCPEGQKETVKQMYAKKTNGEPLILVNEDFAKMVSVNVFSLGIVNHTDELQDLKHEYINEALTFFGINNVNVIKKERLVTGEAEQNDEQIWLNRNAMFKARHEAVELINKKFGGDSGWVDIEVCISEQLTSNLQELGVGVQDGTMQ